MQEESWWGDIAQRTVGQYGVGRGGRIDPVSRHHVTRCHDDVHRVFGMLCGLVDLSEVEQRHTFCVRQEMRRRLIVQGDELREFVHLIVEKRIALLQ